MQRRNDTIKQKYSYARVLHKVTDSPKTTREIADSLSYTDKAGKTWRPASGTIAVKLNKLNEAGLIVRSELNSSCATWYKIRK